MKKKIKDIDLYGYKRFRSVKDNITELAESIKKVGLIHPILIDKNGKLIAGARRLNAVGYLGWGEIECSIIDVDEKSAMNQQFDENTKRKDFSNSEIHAIQTYIHKTESKKAGRPKKKEEEETPTDSVGISKSSDKQEDKPKKEKGKSKSKSKKDKEPQQKTSDITDRSTDTIRKISQIMKAESDDPEKQEELDKIKDNINNISVDRSYKKMEGVLNKKKKTKKKQEKEAQLEEDIHNFVKALKENEINFLLKTVKSNKGLKILKEQLTIYV